MASTLAEEFITPLSSPGSSFYSRSSVSASSSSISPVQSLSCLADVLDKGDVKEVETLRHARIKLDARMYKRFSGTLEQTLCVHYKKTPFAIQLLEITRELHIPGWSDTPEKVAPQDVEICKVSGALTNAVFFVSRKATTTVASATKYHLTPPQTLLLRVYGPSSGSLISRTRELHTLHMISTKYNIGPRIYGTFENGRFEEYFSSIALTPNDLQDPKISCWIAARMAELHSVNISFVDNIIAGRSDSLNSTSKEVNNGKAKDASTHGIEIAANVGSWLGPAEKVLELPQVSDNLRNEFDLGRFKEEWRKYLARAVRRPETFGTRRVFSHNDAQYGNLLRLNDGSDGSVDEHRQIIVVDFEYAAPNPAAYDIANHFHEWTANYHSEKPHVLDPSRYPTVHQRRNFYASYIHHAAMLAENPWWLDEEGAHEESLGLAKLLEEMDRDVEIWGAASHAGWAIWGIVQARENIEAGVDEPEFDYIEYARGRMDAFRRDLKKLGIIA